MNLLLATLILAAAPLAAQPIDADADGIPDPIEAQIGTDPRSADAFELLYDDKSKQEGDKSIGAENQEANDFTKVWFCSAARDRYVWKIEFTRPWQDLSHVATILYVDADDNQDTGRRDKEFARGVDMMLRPQGTSMFEWPGLVKTTGAGDGNVLYLVADIKLCQREGKSAYRFMLLTQDTREGRSRDQDNMPFVSVVAAGRRDRPRVEVPASHPLYHPPEVISNLAARMIADMPEPTAEITWITSWPCDAKVEYGVAPELNQTAQAEPAMQNHRVFIPVEEGKQYQYRVVCTSSEDEPRATEAMAFEATLPGKRGTVDRGEVTLALASGGAVALPAAPYLAGVPFPPGELGSAESIRALQEGREVPVQSTCAARWPDGTVRWAIVQFLADRPAGEDGAVAIEYGNAVKPAAQDAAPMVVDEGDLLVCNTGSLKAVIDEIDFGLFQSLSLDRNKDGAFSPDEELIGQQVDGGLYLVDGQGKGYRSGRPEEVTIEENGPVRAVVKVRGHHLAEDGSALFEYIVRLMFYRGHSFVRILHTFGNDNVSQPLTDVRSMGMRLPLALSGDAQWGVLAYFDEFQGKPGYGAVLATGKGARIEMRQVRHDRFTAVSADGDPEGQKTGVETEGIFFRDGTPQSYLRGYVNVADLREQYPKGWAVADNTLDIQLCPELKGDEYNDADPVTSDRLYYYMRDGVYRFHRGVSKTHGIFLGLACVEGEEPPELLGLQLHMEHRAWVVSPSPEWIAKTGAAGLMTPRTEGQFTEYEDLVERSFTAFEKRREQLGEYGMLNFGDWWGERGYNWGNVEYDTQHVMLTEYLRTGDRKYLKRGCEAALHNRDVDGVHYAPNPRAVGTVIAHCMFHTGDYEVRTPDPGPAFPTGGFDRGHVWTRGLFEHYVLTGDKRSGEWALAVSDYLAGPLTVGFSVGNHAERDTAWPIFGVMAAYEYTADPYYLNAARLMVEDVIRRQIPETGNWGFPAGYSQVEPKPIGGYAWCCGLLITSLDLYNRYVHDPRVDEVNVRAARWLVRDEWVPDKQGFRATSCPTFNASTPPGGSCWSCGNAMLIAHKLTGEQQFLDIGRCGFARLVQGTSSMGKSVTQTICLGPETLWRLRELGITSLDPSAYMPAGQAHMPGTLVALQGNAVALPVVLTSGRNAPQQARVRVSGPEGIMVVPFEASAELTNAGHEAVLPFEVSGTDTLRAGQTVRLTVHWSIGDLKGSQAVTLVRAGEATVGEGVGLIASGEDFLGPALDAIGLRYARVADLDALGAYGTLMLGTQAHSIDSGRLREGYWKLFPWIHAGGTLLVSQLNDAGWERWFLPYEIIVEELDGDSGAAAAADHPVLAGGIDPSGVKMYDTLRVRAEDPWTVLVRDAAGGPAVLEAPFGRGRIVLMQPSYERLATTEPNSAGAEVFRRVVAHVVGE